MVYNLAYNEIIQTIETMKLRVNSTHNMAPTKDFLQW